MRYNYNWKTVHIIYIEVNAGKHHNKENVFLWGSRKLKTPMAQSRKCYDTFLIKLIKKNNNNLY